ncbi:uncharacterized protein LOC135947985 [Cloeon dipterum]|uniref:uncharacterized protein LOC135947985 n=1 Tax=Cloeon dipterum TaxID=197152 RepID=UPI0032200C73
MNLSEIMLVLGSLLLAVHSSSALALLRPKLVRQTRSWRTIPAYQEPLPAYYPAYDEFEPFDYATAVEDEYADEPGSNLPIGQETWFEAEKSKVNDAFMHNLMELYRHEPAQQQYYEPHYNSYDQPQYYSSDEQQLKVLKRDFSSSTAAPAVASAVSRPPAQQGQKEVAMLRPPNPLKGHAEAKPTAHPASIYDAIKRLFTIQDLQEGQSHIKKTQKRYAPSEESLVKQLNSLKKMSA